MIRNAASALLRRSTASATTANLSRATPAQIVVRHPQSPALSSERGFHAAAKSGQRRADTTMLLPARRHGHSAAKKTMENSSSIEEKKAALLQVLFNEEATAAAHKRNKQEIAKASLMEEKVKLSMEMDKLKEARKARTEELLAMIGRQGASGVDPETLMLARLAKAGQDIQDLELIAGFLAIGLAVVGGATGYLCFSS